MSDKIVVKKCRFCDGDRIHPTGRYVTENDIPVCEQHERAAIPGKVEMFDGKLREVVDASRMGWYRFHKHYDRDGYCDNPGRGVLSHEHVGTLRPPSIPLQGPQTRLPSASGARTPANGHLCGGAGAYPRHHD